MSEFKVGDRVRVTHEYPQYDGLTGTVQEVRGNNVPYPYALKLDPNNDYNGDFLVDGREIELETPTPLVTVVRRCTFTYTVLGQEITEQQAKQLLRELEDVV